MQKIFTDVQSSRHIIYLGYEQTCTWQMFLHSVPQEEQPADRPLGIYGNDLIKIKHSELEGLLCASISFQGENPEVYFRKYNGQHLEETESVGPAD